jgi:hypothetical protein
MDAQNINSLVNWVSNLKDESIIRQLLLLREESSKSSSKITMEELYSMLQSSNEDLLNERTISLNDVEKDSKNW